MHGYGRVALTVLAGVALAIGAAACGGGGAGGAGGGGAGGGGASASSGGGGTGGASIPTSLPSGATLGCDEAPASNCAYGGAASAPSGVKVVNINTKITANMFKLSPPMALVTDKSAPGGQYIAIPQGAGSTSQNNGNAVVAVNIPQDGYYIVWAATQSGDTTTSTDSFFVGFGYPDPVTPDLDHTWSINPDNTWHVQDSQGGCIQLVHQGPNDAPNGCDTWHFKKGVLVINIDGRESDSHLAWLMVSPANPAKPLGDQRGG
jgi:hypothetical protein